ncbi:MAG: hypothetical protein CL583_13425 [Alteromonadaceae bacterium]|nr:hypothetical protein [Alteromonadaceae bacterium]
MSELGKTYAEQAAAIGCGCKDHQVRDWVRRKGIPREWLQPVADAHETATLEELLATVTVRPEPQQGAA